MRIETKHELRPVTEHEQRNHAVSWGTLFVSIFIEGELAHEAAILTGPSSDIQDVIDGKKRLTEVEGEWAFIGKGRIGTT